MFNAGGPHDAQTSPASRSLTQPQGQAPLLLDSSHAFRQVVKELAAFREDGTISDDQLERLLIYACGILVEQEVDRRFHTILDRALSVDRIVKVLT